MRFTSLAHRAPVTLLLVASLAAAAPRPPAVAFLPPTASDELKPLALLVEARASELVEASGKVSELHLKQALRAASEEDLLRADFTADAGAVDLARLALGADRVLAFTLTGGGKGFTIAGTVHDGKKTTKFSAPAGATWSEAIDKGGAALAKALLGAVPMPKKLTAQPASANEDALKALARCYAVVIRQPLGVENPAVLEAAELEGAIADCSKAVELDPGLRFANATLALAQAVLGADAAATKALAALGDGDDALEIYTLARFWMLTRFQSNEAGLAFLKDVVKKHPGELIALAYLGDTQLAVGAFSDAEVTWRQFLALAPSAWAWGRLSKALARQDKHDDAIAAAKKGLELAPKSLEARLELGSRLIDANKPAEAEEQLKPLAAIAAPKGEHLLRLGWTHWLQGEVDDAATHFQKALDVATSPGEWRTRGRAFYDLALVEAKRGHKEPARVALRAAMQTGYKLRKVDASLTDVVRELERGEAQVDAGGTKASLVPRESSLFPVDAFGDPDAKAKKPPPPNGLVLYRF